MESKALSFGVRGSVQKILDIPANRLVYFLIEPHRQADASPNFFCTDKTTGTIVWTLSADKRRSKDNTFCDAKYDSDSGLLLLWDWDGYKYRIDPITGDMKGQDFQK